MFSKKTPWKLALFYFFFQKKHFFSLNWDDWYVFCTILVSLCHYFLYPIIIP